MDVSSRSAKATFVTIAVLLLFVAGLQYASDASRIRSHTITDPPTAAFVRTFDLGLHSAAASFLWLSVIHELPFFPYGADHFFSGFETIVGLDPQFSFPYAHATIVLPVVKNYPPKIDKTLLIGRRGAAVADPDWRIPFYLAATYQLDKLDIENAVRFYEQTARTPGVPDLIQKFSANFGSSKKLREETRIVWTAIYASTSDELLKERAKKTLERFALFDALEAAAGEYKRRFGVFPKTPEEMVERLVVRDVPPDPFGAPLYFNALGGVTLNAPTPGT